MTKINAAQEAYLPLVTKAWADEVAQAAILKARLYEQLRVELASLTQRTDQALAAASSAGVPVRRIMQAIGTTNFPVVKERIASGLANYNKPIDPVRAPVSVHDFLDVTQSPAHEGSWRVTATDLPSNYWTHEPSGGTVWTPTYSGFLDVMKDTGQVSLRGKNSDPMGPLHMEWVRGDGVIRDVLKGL